MTVVTHPACALGLRLLLFFSAFLFWISAWQKDFSVPGKPRLDMWHHRHISNPSRVSKWPPSNQGWTGWSSTLPPNVLCKKNGLFIVLSSFRISHSTWLPSSSLTSFPAGVTSLAPRCLAKTFYKFQDAWEVWVHGSLMLWILRNWRPEQLVFSWERKKQFKHAVGAKLLFSFRSARKEQLVLNCTWAFCPVVHTLYANATCELREGR